MDNNNKRYGGRDRNNSNPKRPHLNDHFFDASFNNARMRPNIPQLNPYLADRMMNAFVMEAMEQPTEVNCGELREKDGGLRVRISGKVNKIRLTRFIEIRDVNGFTQLVAPDDRPHIGLKFQTIPLDSYITVFGTVQVRPNNFRNNSISTGAIEIVVEDIKKMVLPLNEPRNLHMHQNQRRNYSSCNSSRAEKEPNRLVTSIEYKKATSESILNYFNTRETTCGELRAVDCGKVVTLIGWLDSKKHGRFLHMKDGHGLTQIIIDETECEGIRKTIDLVTDTSIVKVTGRVIARPTSNTNVHLETGEIEVFVEDFQILDPDETFTGPVKAAIIATVQDQAIKQSASVVKSAAPTSPDVNKYALRSYNCGQLTEHNIGEEVTLVGWLEFQRMKKFLTLRDGYGCTQVIVPDELCNDMNLDAIPLESVLMIRGIVMGRPPNMINSSMFTGGIEVNLKNLTLLNEAKKNLPIEMRTHNRSNETMRLKHRYLDLRFRDMQTNLRTRSKVLMKMREYLINHLGFVEVETPTLFRRTPGGAQEFVVPSRKAGHFYSLVQSPQQFKQMLMVGSIDRYFQIARCYRDESTRPDRQPEFTQLDIELSFTTREKIMQLIEGTLVHCWPESNGTLTTPFPVMTYNDAMELYGSDKPDLRFDLKLKNVTSLVELNVDLVKEHKQFGAYVIHLKIPEAIVPNEIRDKIKGLNKDLKAKIIVSRVTNPTIEEWIAGPLSKLLSEVVTKSLAADLHLVPQDLIIMAFGSKEDAQILMGRARLLLQENLEERKLSPPRNGKENNFSWIVDFPMFGFDEDTQKYESVHHPFTAAHMQDKNMLEEKENWLNIRSQAYDLVLNGQEVGGGSIRIHDATIQKFVLDDVLKIEHQHLDHMLEALKSGCPPHGGIALGIDRLLAIICGTNSIRDVIAFPKGLDGKDHLSKAPVPISEEEMKLYHIKVVDCENILNEDQEMVSVDQVIQENTASGSSIN